MIKFNFRNGVWLRDVPWSWSADQFRGSNIERAWASLFLRSLQDRELDPMDKFLELLHMLVLRNNGAERMTGSMVMEH